MTDKPESNVESLYGGAVIADFDTHPAVIELLEEMLEAAQSGEILGFTGVVMHSDGSTSLREAGLSNRSTIGGLEVAKIRLVMDDLS